MAGALQSELRILLQTAFHEAITASDKRCNERKANEGKFPKELARLIGKARPGSR